MKRKILFFGIIPLIILSLGILGWYLNKADSYTFVKAGEIKFVDQATNSKITTIDVELANTPSLRTQGLMNRERLENNQGMLFVFPTAEPRSFWMKNTPLSLDIIYADQEGVIVSIVQHTTPFSEESIDSGKPAMYVVEAKAGFCEKYGIQSGDRLYYKANEQ